MNEIAFTSIQLAVAAILLLVGLLFVRFQSYIKSSFSGQLFRSLCWLALIVSGIEAAAYYLYMIDWDGYERTIFVMIGMRDIAGVLVVAQWLILVEYLLHKSKDLIRRHYPIRLVPAGIAILLSFVIMIVGTGSKNYDEIEPILTLLMDITDYVIILYMIASYALIFIEQKIVKMPLFLSFTPFIIPALVGEIWNTYTDFAGMGLGFAVGLMLMNFSLINWLVYIDLNTGFYNRNFLKYLGDYEKKRGYEGESAFFFWGPHDREKMAGILRRFMPDNSECVVLDKGRFMIVSEKQGDDVSDAFVNFMVKIAEENGIKIKGKYDKRHANESIYEFFDRLIGEGNNA